MVISCDIPIKVSTVLNGTVDTTALAPHSSRYWFTTMIQAGGLLIHLKSKIPAICYRYLPAILQNKKRYILKALHEACLLGTLGFVLFWLVVKWPFVNSYLSDIRSPISGHTLSLLPGVAAIQISMFFMLHKIIEPTPALPSAALKAVWTDRGRKWSRFIAVHLSSQTQREAVQLLPNSIQGSVIYWLKYRGYEWCEVFFKVQTYLTHSGLWILLWKTVSLCQKALFLTRLSH